MGKRGNTRIWRVKKRRKKIQLQKIQGVTEVNVIFGGHGA
jgi:hypothetical protein